MSALHIAEIPFVDGRIRYRYAASCRRMARVGYGTASSILSTQMGLASMGTYLNGAEEDLWQDFRVDNELAAAVTYQAGKKATDWRY